MNEPKAVFYDGEKLLSQFGDTDPVQIANQKLGDFSGIVRVTGPNRCCKCTFN